MTRRFEMKEVVGKLNPRRLGGYKVIEEKLRKENLLVEVVETTSKGGGGKVFFVKKNGMGFFAISTYSRKVVSRKNKMTHYFYRYYLISPEKFDRVVKLLDIS